MTSKFYRCAERFIAAETKIKNEKMNISSLKPYSIKK